MSWNILMLAVVFAASGSGLDPPVEINLDALPELVLHRIAVHLPSDQDLCNLSRASIIAYCAYPRLLHARRQLHRLHRVLSSRGLLDGAWMHLFDIDLDHLQLPDLPLDFPSDLCQRIVEIANDAGSPTDPHGRVEQIRASFPSVFRAVFPFGKYISQQLVQQCADKSILLDCNVLRVLAMYGIIFDKDQYESHVVADHHLNRLNFTTYIAPLLASSTPESPSGFLYSLLKQLVSSNGDRVFVTVFQMPEFNSLMDSHNEEVVHALQAFMGSMSMALLEELLNTAPVRRFINSKDYFGRTLLHYAFKLGRVSDLARLLIAIPECDFEAVSHTGETIISLLPMEENAFLDMFHLRSNARFNQFFTANFHRLLNRIFSDLILDRHVQLIRSMIKNEDIAALLISHSATVNSTLMHIAVQFQQFNIVADLLHVPDAEFRILDFEQRSAIALLNLDRAGEFIACLPEPKFSSLCKFHMPDLVKMLIEAAEINWVQPIVVFCERFPQLAVYEYDGSSVWSTAVKCNLADLSLQLERIRNLAEF